MANNYLQFCVEIENLTDEELAWVRHNLESCNFDLDKTYDNLDVINANPNNYRDALLTLGIEWDVPREVWEYESLDFSPVIDGRAVFLEAEESGSPDNAATFLQGFLRKWRPDSYASLTWAATCSKLRPDEFGGGAFFITKDKIESIDSGSWIAQKSREHEER